MTREEGLRFCNEYNRITTPGERNVDYAKISQMKTADLKEFVLHDEN